MRRSQLEAWMSVAVSECRKGLEQGESPFGAAIFDPGGELVAAQFNVVNTQQDPTAHAEVMAIRAACQTLGVMTLEEHWLVSTGEPCLMCASVAVTAGIRKLAYGADCRFIDAVGFETWGVTSEHIFRDAGIEVEVEGGILKDQCETLLRESQASRSI
ncbi:tRNA-specific adenosine deaminase [Novipirellula galeiformis]|uniref:tRNA-specific adenosine deaminase n=1 Tax=Novipirellula galeiformis TaxID=2528004 RepID=A0A5C6CU74_9BACT|nr:nucleoside deaminase [Novipirellula galeiformis]TWU26299.1 tRNA-specific adenosine deaminase [Novipirellula galeiformis]